MGRKARVTAAKRIERERRIAEILSLRVSGRSLREIGESLNPAISAQAVFTCIRKAVAGMAREATEQVRRLEALRLDELTTGVYEQALAGDVAAVDRVLAISYRRARLLGLDVQPTRGVADPFATPKVVVEVVGGAELATRAMLATAQADGDPPN
jgi:hypothetical protein